VSSKLGVKRPQKVKRDPVERQNMVKDALRVATEGEAVPGYRPDSSSSSSKAGEKQWWQEQFQAVFLPSIRWVWGLGGWVVVFLEECKGVRGSTCYSDEP